MPAFLITSSKVSFLSPTSLLVLRSEMTSERILGSIFLDDFRDGQYLIPFEIFRIFSHPVSLLVFRFPLLALSWGGALLCWLDFWAALAALDVLTVSGDRQRRPICPYQALLGQCLLSLLRCLFIWRRGRTGRGTLHGCSGSSCQEGRNNASTCSKYGGGVLLFKHKTSLK